VAKKRHGDCGIQVTAECQGSWCKVEDGHSLGWVNRGSSRWSRRRSIVSPGRIRDTLNLRAYPSTKSRVLAELDRRQCDIQFLPYAVGSWQKVRVEGQQGWVGRKYLSGE
jgi:SH3-like domain-containing protein